VTPVREDPAEARRVLTEKRAEIQRLLDLGEDAAAVVEADPQRIGRLSRIDALQQQAMAQDAERRRRQELVRIEAALERVDEGEYGHCLACGEPIPEGRLALDPAATLCVACAGSAGRH
jgi:DnaK suppressor protein